jgi:hypothetical protein
LTWRLQYSLLFLWSPEKENIPSRKKNESKEVCPLSLGVEELPLKIE